jgi:hypothetical protein
MRQTTQRQFRAMWHSSNAPHFEPRGHRVVLEIVEQDVNAVEQISLVERVVHVPPDRPELSSLDDDGVVVPVGDQTNAQAHMRE